MYRCKRIAGLGVLLFTFLFITGCSKSPDDVVLEFYKLANEGQMDVAVETLFTSNMQQVMAFAGGLTGTDINGTIKKNSISKVSVIDSKIDGKRANVSVEVKYKDGNKGKDNYTLIKSDKKWLISDVGL